MTNYVEELRRVKKEEPRQLYWFATENAYLQKELLKAIADKISPGSANIEEIDLGQTDINDFRFIIGSGSLLSGGKVITVAGATKIKAERGKLLTEILEDICPSNIVVFTDTQISGATSLGKYLSSRALVIEESGLDDKMIVAWAKKRFQNSSCEVSDDALAILIERTMGDLTMLAQEIDKIVFYVGQTKKVNAADVKQNVNERTEVVIFQVLDELAAKQTAKGIRLLHKIVSDGEPPERIVVMLYNHFLRVLGAQSLSSSKLSQPEIAKKLACHPFVAKKALQTSSMFTRDELICYLEQIENAEIAFKTGASKALEAIECALFQLVK